MRLDSAVLECYKPSSRSTALLVTGSPVLDYHPVNEYGIHLLALLFYSGFTQEPSAFQVHRETNIVVSIMPNKSPKKPLYIYIVFIKKYLIAQSIIIFAIIIFVYIVLTTKYKSFFEKL